MNRADALTYLQQEYAELATESGIDSPSLTSAYQTAIDQGLRGLEVTEDALTTAVVSNSDVAGFLALLDFYALTRFARVFALRVNVSVAGAVSAQQAQTFAQVETLLTRAEKRLEGLGLSPTEQLVAGRFTLDYLTPGMDGWA